MLCRVTSSNQDFSAGTSLLNIIFTNHILSYLAFITLQIFYPHEVLNLINRQIKRRQVIFLTPQFLYFNSPTMLPIFYYGTWVTAVTTEPKPA